MKLYECLNYKLTSRLSGVRWPQHGGVHGSLSPPGVSMYGSSALPRPLDLQLSAFHGVNSLEVDRWL